MFCSNQYFKNFVDEIFLELDCSSNFETNYHLEFYVWSSLFSCSSPVGYRYGRVNKISLASGCQYKGTAMHEIGHSIGLYHEQSRPDRDYYVRILWNNIPQGTKWSTKFILRYLRYIIFSNTENLYFKSFRFLKAFRPFTNSMFVENYITKLHDFIYLLSYQIAKDKQFVWYIN